MKPKLIAAWLLFVLPFPLVAGAQTTRSDDDRQSVAPAAEVAKPRKTTQVFRLKYAQPERAMQIVRDALGAGRRGAAPFGEANIAVNIGVDTQANLLIVSGAEGDVKQVEQMLTEIDVPREDRDEVALKIFSLKHADAQQALIIIREATEGGDRQLNIAVDSRTNSLVARGLRPELELVEALLLRLDEPTELRNVHVEVVVCELRGDPSEVLRDFQSAHGLRIPATADVELVFDDLLPTLAEAGAIGEPIRLSGTTFENESIEIKLGFDKPIVQATTVHERGRNNSVMYRSMGTIVKVVPALLGDGVRIDLELEHSRLGSEDRGTVVSEPAEGEAIRAPASAQSSFKGSLLVPEGKAILFGVMSGDDDSVDKGLLVAIRAQAE
jgi:type II secretory pathway component GspD/PulD (secretin)